MVVDFMQIFTRDQYEPPSPSVPPSKATEKENITATRTTYFVAPYYLEIDITKQYSAESIHVFDSCSTKKKHKFNLITYLFLYEHRQPRYLQITKVKRAEIMGKKRKSTGNNQSQSANQSGNVPENNNENTQNGNVTTNKSIGNTIQQKNNNKKKRKRNRSLSPNPTRNNSSASSSPSLNSVNKSRGNGNNRNKKRRKTKSRQTFWVETTGKDCDNVLQQSKSGDVKKSASGVGTQIMNHSQDQSNLTIVITKSYIIDGFMNEAVDCNSDYKSVKNQYSIDSEFLRCLEEESYNRPETLNNNKKNKIIVYRSPSTKKFVPFSSSSNNKNKKSKYIELPNGNNGDGIPNPDNGKIDDKYWAQRKRFFTKFDSGIQLDHEGWFSVTPEAIATHIREKTTFLWRMKMKKQEKFQSNSSCEEIQDGIVDNVSGNNSSEKKNDEGLVVLDAFCGCGGNAIAYARDMQNVEESPSKSKIPKIGSNDQTKTISLVIAVDIDLNKLKMAAHNASIYNISSKKILFVHGDAIHVLKKLNLPRKKMNQSIIAKEGGHSIFTSAPLFHEGYKIINVSDLGAIDVDVVFLSPPWGGVQYKNFGNDFGFDLKNHIQLRVPCNNNASPNNEYEKEDTVKDNSEEIKELSSHNKSYESGSDSEEDGENSESCQIIESSNNMSEQSTVLVDGDELLALASGPNIECETYTTNKENQEQIMNRRQNRMVVYFLPKNLNGFSLGSAALNAGYGSSTMYTEKDKENNKFRNNFIEIEQNMLNGKLKTVTGYLI